jgi:TetR/AcrR family transcriptional regulator
MTATAPAAPRVRDARRTRERILTIASEEFAARGYDGARIEAIVKRCRMSKNLLYHYFEGKEALFIEVMERAYASMRTRQNEVTLTGRDPRGDMHTLVLHMVRHFAEEPEFISLLSTENLHKARHIRKSRVIAEMFNPLIGTLKRLVREGQQQGVFRKDADWVDLYISISGLASYFVSNRYTLSTVLDVDLTSPARMKRRLEHVPEMVLSYLCKIDKPEKRKPRSRA